MEKKINQHVNEICKLFLIYLITREFKIWSEVQVICLEGESRNWDEKISFKIQGSDIYNIRSGAHCGQPRFNFSRAFKDSTWKPPTYSLEVWQSWSKHALASIVVGLNCSQKIQSGTFCFLWAWIECILVIRPSCRNQSVTTAGREQHPARSFTREPSLCLSRQMYNPFVYSLKKKMFLF